MTSAPPKRRSRFGCTECRLRHRKCDEGKPACAGCVRNGKQCDYAVRLSWGGRPFGKSRFGECLKRDPALGRVPVTTAGSNRAFVYGSAPDVKGTHAETGCWDKQLNTQSINPYRPTTTTDDRIQDAVDTKLIRNPDQLSWLPPAQRFLLDHFASCTTLWLSCHPIIQSDFCQVLVPMALQTPYLLAALLGFAATHRSVLGLPQSQSQLDFLKCVSLQQLQEALALQPRRQLSDAVVATTLTLCTTDIISDTRTPGSWRLHLQGTAAIIGDHLQHVRDSPYDLSSTESLLWRWYMSIESLSLLCGNLAMAPLPSSRISLQMRRIINDNEIDDLAGFSASLIPIFGDINLLAMESIEHQQNQIKTLEQPPPTTTTTTTTPPTPTTAQQDPPDIPGDRIRSRCYRLIHDVRNMLASHEPRFRPLVDASLSSLHRIDFVALDETYHHVALLHLYRRVLNLPSSAELVQSSVQQIIRRVSAMHFMREPCPGVAVLQPVFTAGCEACNPTQRAEICELLTHIEKRYGMGNAKSVRGFLEELWVMRDERGDEEGRMRWDEVMVTMGLDIFPY